jgi:hypothetical protein
MTVPNFVTYTVRLRISDASFVTYMEDMWEDEEEDVISYWINIRKRRRY